MLIGSLPSPNIRTPAAATSAPVSQEIAQIASAPPKTTQATAAQVKENRNFIQQLGNDIRYAIENNPLTGSQPKPKARAGVRNAQSVVAKNQPERITGWQALGIDKNSADARYLVGGVAGEAGKGEEIAIAKAMLNRTDGYNDGKQSYPGGSMRDILSRRGQFSTIGHHYHGNVDLVGQSGGPRAAEKNRVRALLNSTKTAAEWKALGANHDMEYFQSPGGGRYHTYSDNNTFNGGRTRFSKAW